MLGLESYVIIPLMVSVAAIIIVLLAIKGRKNSKSYSKLQKGKANDRSAVMKEAQRRLSSNPKDPAALVYLAEMYYNDKNWDKAFKLYDVLLELCATDKELDEFSITLKHAVCALNTKQYKVAYKGFMLARTVNSDVFIINYNLGYLEYMRKNYEKAVGFLNQAKTQKADDLNTYKYLGLSLFKMNKYTDASEVLKKTIEMDPENKELVFSLGECYYNLGQSDAALRVFGSIRTDPKYGAHACIYAGTISLKFRNYDQAAMYFELGLKNPSVKPEVVMELRYRLANCYIKASKISSAIIPLQQIYEANPNYKDTAALLKNYGELNQNSNLQLFLIGPMPQFVSMCRKLTSEFFPKTKIKVMEISKQQNDYVDMLVEVVAPKWEDIVLFRMVRSSGQTGELIVRDLYGKIKETRAGRGICISAGYFTDGAKNFVEARLIDLIEKEALVKKMERITVSV